MNQHQIHAYVPEELLQRNKEELPCMQFREDVAIVCPAEDNRILTARGIGLRAGDRLFISDGERATIDMAIADRKTATIVEKDRLLLVFTELFDKTGLLCVVLPHGKAATLARALRIINPQSVLCSDAVSALSASGVRDEDAILHMIEENYLFQRILNVNNAVDFRLHIAHIAELAGCRVNVRELPIGAFPIDRIDFVKWTAFLLCTFLSLRGDSAQDTKLELTDASRREFHLHMSHISEHSDKMPIENRLFAFLQLPCFSGYHFCKTKEGFVLDTALLRQGYRSVRAPSWNDYFCMVFLLME